MRIFVIGNGPTQNNIDLGCLVNETTLAFNDITGRLHEFTPTYWMYFDLEVYRGYGGKMLEQKEKGTRFISLHRHIEGAEIINAFGSIPSLRKGKMEFYDKKMGWIYSVGSIGYAGLQWAWQKGFREFYVMGFDSRDPRPAEHYMNGYCEMGKKKIGDSLPEGVWGKAYDYANEWIWMHDGEIWDISGSGCGSFPYKPPEVFYGRL